MESRVKLLGHPIHPMLVVFPLGLFSTDVVFDVLYVISGNGDLALFSFWAIAAGIVGGLAAAVFGLIDWLAIPAGTRAKTIGLVHGVGNVVIVGVFTLSWLLRLNNPTYLPNLLPLVLGLIGAGMALFTAWLGGELVYRLRIGVDDDANANAPSSIGQTRRTGVEASRTHS